MRTPRFELEKAMNEDRDSGLLQRILSAWFGRDTASIPAIPITDEPTAADVERAHELIQKHGWQHLLSGK